MNSLFDPVFLDSLGVVDWGYTEEAEATSFDKLIDWTSKGSSAPLSYLEDHRRDLRQDLRLVYPEFQSAVVFLFSYRPAKKWMLENERHEVAGYSMGFGGADYHLVLKDRLDKIFEQLAKDNEKLKSFLVLDTQPVLERDLAYRAGLGWFGKNSMLISRKEGSYFLIGSLLLNQKLPLDQRSIESDHCGTCCACIDACPTLAIDPVSRTIKASDCISTFTIEIFKDSPPPKGMDTSRGEIFGCDICQDVCPWNKKTLQTTTAQLQLLEQFKFLGEWFYQFPKHLLLETISSFSGRGIRRKLEGTPFGRPGKEGWLKNLKAYFQEK
jgi:epoxyqueuosine reductase